jgi:hypothetical protein
MHHDVYPAAQKSKKTYLTNNEYAASWFQWGGLLWCYLTSEYSDLRWAIDCSFHSGRQLYYGNSDNKPEIHRGKVGSPWS